MEEYGTPQPRDWTHRSGWVQVRQNKTWRLDSQIWLDPGEPKLLLMDDAVAIHDLFNQILALFLIHAPDVMELFGICCHEVPGKDTHTHTLHLPACMFSHLFFFKLFLPHYNMGGKQWNKDQKQNSLKTGRHHIRLIPLPITTHPSYTHTHTHTHTHRGVDENKTEVHIK